MQGSILRMASSDMWRIGRSIPHIDDGAEDVGNLNTSVHGESRNLNVLRRWRVKWKFALSNDLLSDAHRMKEQETVVNKNGKCLTR